MERIETFTRNGLTFALESEPDDSYGEPWKESDGYGIVTDWRRGRDKRPGERVIAEGRGSYRFYDMRETMRLAKRDAWGLSDEARAELARKLGRDPKPGDITVAAVERDFQRLRAWFNDEWCYLTLRVVLLDVDGDETGADDYLGGVESDGDYAKECARDMADNIIATHKLARRKFLQDGASRTRIKD